MSEFILSAFSDEIDVELENQMNVLEEHNISCIEIRGVDGKGICEYSLEEVKKIKNRLDAREFKISAIGSPVGKIYITDDFQPHLALFKHTIEIAKIMETKYIRMFSFFIPEGEDPAKYRDEVMYRWKQFIKVAEGSGVILLHENEKDIYGDTAERCLDVLQTMNCEYVRATFDPANFVQCNEKVFPEAYELLKDYVEYIHIKDALYSDGNVVPAGDGDGKVKEVLTTLYNKGYKGFLSLEPHLTEFQGLGGLEIGKETQESKDDGAKCFEIAVGALKRMITEITE